MGSYLEEVRPHEVFWWLYSHCSVMLHSAVADFNDKYLLFTISESALFCIELYSR